MRCRHGKEYPPEKVWVSEKNPNKSPHGKLRPFHCAHCSYKNKAGAKPHWWEQTLVWLALKKGRAPCTNCF